MPSRDRIAALGLLSLVLAFWLGFLVHRDARFAGSAWGGLFGVSATACMLVALAFSALKRIKAIRTPLTRRIRMSTWVQIHAVLALTGSLLAFVHSGHAFRSVLGFALLAALLLTVFTGFIGQYYLRYVAENLRENEAELGVLWRAIEIKTRTLSAVSTDAALSMRAVAELLPLAEATADLQYSVQSQVRIRQLFSAWRIVHIVCGVAFMVLLTLHIWSGIHFGLRWFR